MDTLERYRGCLLGLAVGDAFGGQLEHAADPFHTPVLFEPPFRTWDDTAQALAVGRALLDAIEVDADVHDLPRHVTDQFVAWHQASLAADRTRDPTTAEAMARWTASGGRKGPDGLHQPSVLAVRAVPVGLAYAPAEVVVPARTVTCVSHHNHTAVEAAVFSAWLTSCLVRGVPLDVALVEEGREIVGDLGFGGFLGDALADALALYGRLVDRPLQWLPEDEITPGDGGWRADSAVGLAVVAALLAPKTEDIEGSIELASRIRGDSNGVAALTGAWLGAARGSAALPPALVGPLEARDVLEGLADALHAAAM